MRRENRPAMRNSSRRKLNFPTMPEDWGEGVGIHMDRIEEEEDCQGVLGRVCDASSAKAFRPNAEAATAVLNAKCRFFDR